MYFFFISPFSLCAVQIIAVTVLPTKYFFPQPYFLVLLVLRQSHISSSGQWALNDNDVGHLKRTQGKVNIQFSLCLSLFQQLRYPHGPNVIMTRGRIALNLDPKVSLRTEPLSIEIYIACHYGMSFSTLIHSPHF